MVRAVDTKRPSWEYLVELDRRASHPIRKIAIRMAYRLTSKALAGRGYEKPFPLVFDVEREKAVETRASFFQPATYAGNSPKTVVLSREEKKPMSEAERGAATEQTSKD